MSRFQTFDANIIGIVLTDCDLNLQNEPCNLQTMSDSESDEPVSINCLEGIHNLLLIKDINVNP